MSSKQETVVAVLGLGAMGARMAQRILATGAYDVVVHNRTASRAAALLEGGARWADTPREAAAQADVVICVVTDREAAAQIWLHPETGAAGGLQEGSLAVEASTLTPTAIAELAPAVRARGAALVDAPVVGSRPQAEAGALVTLIGGEEADVERARPVLSAYSKLVRRCGPLGRGTAMKLVVNAWLAIQTAAMGEVLGLAEDNGISRAEAAGLLQALPVTSPALGGLSQLIVEGTFAPLFPVDLVEKDLRYAVSSARQAPLAEAARATYARASEAGYGDQNIHAVARLFLQA